MWHIFPALTTNYAHNTTGTETLTCTTTPKLT